MKTTLLMIAGLSVALYAQALPPHAFSERAILKFNYQQADRVNYRKKAYNIMRKLKSGGIVVRLKTEQKSVDAYKKDGEEKIAQHIIDRQKAQNKKIYDAFTQYFNFCKVYFIYADDTRKCLQGKHVFLNHDLAYDNSIALRDTNFIFCEYGSAEAYSRYTDISGLAVDEPSLSSYKYSVTETTNVADSGIRETSTGPASTSCLFFVDRKGNQLFPPFPAPESVNVNNYGDAVSKLNEEMDKAYFNLVLNKKPDQVLK